MFEEEREGGKGYEPPDPPEQEPEPEPEPEQPEPEPLEEEPQLNAKQEGIILELGFRPQELPIVPISFTPKEPSEKPAEKPPEEKPPKEPTIPEVPPDIEE